MRADDIGDDNTSVASPSGVLASGGRFVAPVNMTECVKKFRSYSHARRRAAKRQNTDRLDFIIVSRSGGPDTALGAWNNVAQCSTAMGFFSFVQRGST